MGDASGCRPLEGTSTDSLVPSVFRSDLQHGSKAEHYSPLDTTKNQIRLLSFAEQNTKTINLNVETFDLEDCPEYEAISYTWGSDGDSMFHHVELNGNMFSVRQNLHDVLVSHSMKQRC
jgi:hypothetical protein